MTAFESSLERDCLLLLDFDPEVEFYEEQLGVINDLW
jgi:hypothetical protein